MRLPPRSSDSDADEEDNVPVERSSPMDEDISSSDESSENEDELRYFSKPKPKTQQPSVKRNKKRPRTPPPSPVDEPVEEAIETVHFPQVRKKKSAKSRINADDKPDVMIDMSKDGHEDSGMARVLSAVSSRTEAEMKPKRHKPRAPAVEVPTSNPHVTVKMKKRKPGPAKQEVVIYQEDLPQPKFKIVTKTRKRGRPKTKPEVTIDDEDQGVQIGEDKITIDRPNKTKELSARQLKRMELDAEFVKMEAIAGRPLRQNKNGQVDKRCVKQRTPAQMAAARRLAEYNKEVRLKKQEEKNKTAVKQVISELAIAQEMKKSTEKKPEEATQSKSFSLFAD